MTKDEKISLIQEQQKSGMSQAKFCAKKSINVAAFRQWKYFLKKSHSSSAKFIELIPKAQKSMPITVVVGRYRIEVPIDFNKEQLRALLESLPC